MQKKTAWKNCETQGEVAVMVKFLITTIQANLVLIPSEAWRRQNKFAWIVVIKNFAIILSSQPLLGRHLEFHNFFMLSFLHGPHLFLQLGCFCVDSLNKPSYFLFQDFASEVSYACERMILWIWRWIWTKRQISVLAKIHILLPFTWYLLSWRMLFEVVFRCMFH